MWNPFRKLRNRGQDYEQHVVVERDVQLAIDRAFSCTVKGPIPAGGVGPLIKNIKIQRLTNSEPEPIGVFQVLGYEPLRVRMHQNTFIEVLAVSSIWRRPYRVIVDYIDGRTETLEWPELVWRLGSHAATTRDPRYPEEWARSGGGNLDFMLLPESRDMPAEVIKLELNYAHVCIP